MAGTARGVRCRTSKRVREKGEKVKEEGGPCAEHSDGLGETRISNASRVTRVHKQSHSFGTDTGFWSSGRQRRHGARGNLCARRWFGTPRTGAVTHVGDSPRTCDPRRCLSTTGVYTWSGTNSAHPLFLFFLYCLFCFSVIFVSFCTSEGGTDIVFTRIVAAHSMDDFIKIWVLASRIFESK